MPTPAPAAGGLPAQTADSANDREPGHHGGPCPVVAAQAKAIFARAAQLAGGERAMAEAVRLRLDAIFQHGCHRGLDRDGLRTAVLEVLPPPPAGQERHLYVEPLAERHILVGYPDLGASWVALYGWKRGKIRSLIVVHGTASRSTEELEVMRAQLLPLDYRAFAPPGASEPLLVLVNTHPWISSCWRSLRFRVLAPTGDPYAPKALLDHTDGGRWCETPRISTTGDLVHFDYFDWSGPWSQDGVWRPYRLTYRHGPSGLTKRFGFVASDDPRRVFTYLVEDWLRQPWALAEQATMPAARDELQAQHAALAGPLRTHRERPDARDRSVYTSELFPVSAAERRLVLYCATDASQPCPQWPKAVDFIVERSEGTWRVKAVKPR